MSLATALISKVIHEGNLDTWANLKERYLPQELKRIYFIVDGHVDKYHKLPTFEELKFEVRDQSTLDKISLIEKEEVDAESILLLDYLKSEFTQKELLVGLDKFVDGSMAHSSAEETIQSMYDVITVIESKVELVKPSDDIQKVELFETDEEMEGSLILGLNEEFDETHKFPCNSFITIGGFRGAGKSIVMNNIAQSQLDRDKSVISFTIEMDIRQVLQRQAAVATGISNQKIRYKELSASEWDQIAIWWANRYENGDDIYQEVYRKFNDFDRFHKALIQSPLKHPLLDIVHTPDLTVAKFKAETLKRLNKYGDSVGCIILDYMNKVRSSEYANDKFDWKEQLMVSDGIKTFAEEINIPIVSPLQVKADGSIKYSGDILVPVDAHFNLSKGDAHMDFECTKNRHFEEKGFCSVMDWMTLRCGPETAIIQTEEDDEEQETPEDLPWA